MDKIFLSVLNMSLTGAFVIAAIMLARLPLKKAPKVISYALWAVAGFRLVFPFTLEGMFSLLPFKSTPIPTDIAMQAVPRIDSGIAVIDNAVSAVLPAASVNPWVDAGAYIWIFGIAIMLIYSLMSIVFLKNRLRNAAHVDGNLYAAGNLKTPFVIGLFRPKIYIPEDLSDEERRYIVLHEQTHIRRHDHAVKMFAYLVLSLHWFNPLAWIAFILMSADMEMSCDERVLKELGGGIKTAYSLSLVRVAAGRKILNGSPLAFGEGGMKERVKNVLNFKKHSRIIIIAAVILAVGLAAGLTVNKTGDAQSQLKENKSAGETVLGTMDDQGGILIEDDRAIYVEGRKAVHMTIAGYEAWVAAGENAADVYDYAERVIYTPIGKSPDERMYMRIDEYKAWAAAGENDADVYDFAVPYIDDGAGTANKTYESQLTTYLSALFTEAYAPHYDGLHYEMTDYEETANASDYTATFLWTMHYKGNGLDVPSDLGKEQEVNFSLKATTKLDDAGLLDLDTIEVLADSSATGPANYAVPIEDFFPES